MLPTPSKILPQAKATSIWRQYGIATPADLVLEDVAFALGILVIDDNLDKADARLVRKGNRGILRVSRNLQEVGRKRFAISHEIGHWLMHQTSTQLLACTSDDMHARYKGSALEIEANYFAAELLMPSHLFGSATRQTGLSAKTIRDLSTVFQTSLTAAAMRYVELTDDYCAAVVCEEGRIRWWRASEQMEGFWLNPGTPLEPHCLAAKYFASGISPTGPEEVDKDAWIECTDQSETIIEDIIPLPRYGQVLSLLRLP